MSSPRGQAAESGQQYGSYQQGQGYEMAPQEGRHTGQRSSGGSIAGSVLGGTLMIIGGAIAFLNGLGMVIKGGFYTYNANYVYHWSTKGWGWTHLILGGVIFAAGFCVLLGMVWARVIGVFLATLGAVAAFLTIPFYPVWSIIEVALFVFIIWALISRRRAAA
jgi:hypothetical protein